MIRLSPHVLFDARGFKLAERVDRAALGYDSTLEVWSAFAQANGSIQTCIRRFLGEESGGPHHLPKRATVAKHTLLKVLDRVLTLVIGRGWRQVVDQTPAS